MIIDGYLEKGVVLSMQDGVLPSEILAFEKGLDKSKLVKKRITTKDGHTTTKWVRANPKDKKDGSLKSMYEEADRLEEEASIKSALTVMGYNTFFDDLTDAQQDKFLALEKKIKDKYGGKYGYRHNRELMDRLRDEAGAANSASYEARKKLRGQPRPSPDVKLSVVEKRLLEKRDAALNARDLRFDAEYARAAAKRSGNLTSAIIDNLVEANKVEQELNFVWSNYRKKLRDKETDKGAPPRRTDRG